MRSPDLLLRQPLSKVMTFICLQIAIWQRCQISRLFHEDAQGAQVIDLSILPLIHHQAPGFSSLELRTPISNLTRRGVAMQTLSRSAAISLEPWVWLPGCRQSRSHWAANLRLGRPATAGWGARRSSGVRLLRPVQWKLPSSPIRFGITILSYGPQ
jgi:hypothetical protein